MDKTKNKGIRATHLLPLIVFSVHFILYLSFSSPHLISHPIHFLFFSITLYPMDVNSVCLDKDIMSTVLSVTIVSSLQLTSVSFNSVSSHLLLSLSLPLAFLMMFFYLFSFAILSFWTCLSLVFHSIFIFLCVFCFFLPLFLLFIPPLSCDNRHVLFCARQPLIHVPIIPVA